MTIFKIGVIGCGQIATGYHGPALQRYADVNKDIVLSSCCDLEPAKAIDFQERFGFQRSYTKYTEMLDEDKPDAISLLVPPDQTCEIACAVLERGFPLITEKPSGRTVSELDQMILAAKKTKTPNQVAFNRRYIPLLQTQRRYLLDHFKPDQIQHIRYDFSRVNRCDDDFSTTAIHAIDASRFLIGSDFENIRFHYQPFPDLGPNVANIFMDCTYKSGATGQLNFYPVSGVITERITLIAFNHTFFLDLPVWNAFDSPGKLKHVKKGKLIFEITGTEVSGSDEEFILNGFYTENESFFDDIRNRRAPEGDLDSSRQSVEIADYIRMRKAEYKS